MTSTAAELLAAVRTAAANNDYPIADDAAFFGSRHMGMGDEPAGLALREGILIQRAVIRRIVMDVLAVTVEGAPAYLLGVFDGEEVVVQASRDLNQIMGALMSTDEDVLIVRRILPDRCSTYVGSIHLIYGVAGWEVIADNTDNSIINELLRGAEELAGEFCELMQ